MANKGLRFAARCIDAVVELVLVIITWYAFGDLHKLFTDLFLAAAVITVYEGVSTAWFRGTPAMRLLGLRIVELDSSAPPSGPVALKRALMSSVLTVVPFIGWGLWAASAFGDALGRGFPDRVSNSMVVPDAFTGMVATKDLAGFADGVRPPRLIAEGRVGDLDVRYRARLRRLNDSRLLAGAIGLLALSAALPVDTSAVVLLGSLAWIVIFVAHETWLVHRTGATPGHVIAGLVIVSRKTGGPPSRGRSFLRALVLGLLLYVPPFWVLFTWWSMLLMRHTDTGRGLHDYAGGTVVVADPRLDPEAQRQRAMRMRLGRAG